MKSFNEPFIEFLTFGKMHGSIGEIQRVIGGKSALMILNQFSGQTLLIKELTPGHRLPGNYQTNKLIRLIGRAKTEMLYRAFGCRVLRIPKYNVKISLTMIPVASPYAKSGPLPYDYHAGHR